MCDTLAVVDRRGLLFAKNSDRPPTEPQVVEAFPSRSPGGRVRTQYLELPDAGACAFVGSRPTWLWGVEHGVNEHGVAIGNEKLYTTGTPRARPEALLGMDVVRLGLERGHSAEHAVEVMTDLIETYGQGGSGERDTCSPYDSSFLVADRTGGWIVETCDRTWAARAIGAGASISNRISLHTDWTRASPDVDPGTDFQAYRHPRIPTTIADHRLRATGRCLAGDGSGPVATDAVIATLRDHGTGPWGAPGAVDAVPPPDEIGADHRGITVCMHARGQQNTTASMVVTVGEEIHLRAALGNPCVSAYVPWSFASSVPAPLGDETTWWRFAPAARPRSSTTPPRSGRSGGSSPRSRAASAPAATPTSSTPRSTPSACDRPPSLARVNRLADETSPYLRQHAENPVDWYPWGEEALARAREEDKPILLSVGYSSCHWCHVMAHESFEDPSIAATMNRLFVNVKVDREERPDIDAVYMDAVQALTGNGGWPMTVFLAPDGRPFYAGTYFPPTDRSGMPGFPRIMDAVADVWANRRDDVEQQTEQLVAAIEANTLAGRIADTRRRPALRRPGPRVRRRRAALRPRRGRVRAGAEVPAVDDPRLPPPRPRARRSARGARDGDDHARRDGRGRDLRPRRGWVRPVLDRRRAGSSPTSRRCSTTRRCSWARTCAATWSPERPATARSWRRRSAMWCATFATATAASSRPRTPIPRASRASSTCGRRPRSPRSAAPTRPRCSGTSA